jgi:hypothetical protein
MILGLIRRIGCAIVLLILGAAAWHFRDRWMPQAREMITSQLPNAPASGWQPLTRAGALRTAERVQRLDRPTGPAYVNIAAADFAAYILGAALTRLADADSVPEALVDDGLLYLRAYIHLADLGGAEALGPLAALVNDPERLVVGGRIETVRPGLAQYRLTRLAVRDLAVPERAVAVLVRRWGPPQHLEGVARDALPIELPAFIADVRLTNDRVTLYKTVR